jgi:hypothetical protein
MEREGDKLPSSTFGPPYEASLAIVFGLLPYEDITTPQLFPLMGQESPSDEREDI